MILNMINYLYVAAYMFSHRLCVLARQMTAATEGTCCFWGGPCGQKQYEHHHFVVKALDLASTSTWICNRNKKDATYLYPPRGMSCFHLGAFVSWLVCWFVSRITQKLQNGFSRDLDGGWVLAQIREHSFLMQIQPEGQSKDFCLTFFYNFITMDSDEKNKAFVGVIALKQRECFWLCDIINSNIKIEVSKSALF